MKLVSTQTRSAAAVLLFLALAIQAPAAIAGDDVWAELKPDLFGDRPISDGSKLLGIKAPYRAHDAALVPIRLDILEAQTPDLYVKEITLVIDKNPAPLAAVFRFGPGSGIARLSTRVRVNSYSDVRAIAELSDGSLHMVSRFVKASGGCSAPAGKEAQMALARMGRMKLKQFSPKPGKTPSALREAQFMVRHPNYSGLQMDQVTGYYIPAHFVRKIDIREGKDLLLSVEGAISLSEDPTVRFSYRPGGGKKLRVRVEDTEDNVYDRSWPAAGKAREGT